MLVGHNTHSNSFLSSDSIKNLKLWINTLSEGCVPDVTFLICLSRNFSFTPLSYLPALPFNSMDRHPKMIYLYPASQLPLDAYGRFHVNPKHLVQVSHLSSLCSQQIERRRGRRQRQAPPESNSSQLSYKTL